MSHDFEEIPNFRRVEKRHARQFTKMAKENAARDRVGGTTLLGNRVTLVYASLRQFTQAILR